MSEIPTTYYVKSDDVPIVYQVFGEGPFDLLFVPGFVSNVEVTRRSPEPHRLLQAAKQVKTRCI